MDLNAENSKEIGNIKRGYRHNASIAPVIGWDHLKIVWILVKYKPKPLDCPINRIFSCVQ
jgi:hypothetical protein